MDCMRVWVGVVKIKFVQVFLALKVLLINEEQSKGKQINLWLNSIVSERLKPILKLWIFPEFDDLHHIAAIEETR